MLNVSILILPFLELVFTYSMKGLSKFCYSKKKRNKKTGNQPATDEKMLIRKQSLTAEVSRRQRRRSTAHKIFEIDDDRPDNKRLPTVLPHPSTNIDPRSSVRANGRSRASSLTSELAEARAMWASKEQDVSTAVESDAMLPPPSTSSVHADGASRAVLLGSKPAEVSTTLAANEQCVNEQETSTTGKSEAAPPPLGACTEKLRMQGNGFDEWTNRMLDEYNRKVPALSDELVEVHNVQRAVRPRTAPAPPHSIPMRPVRRAELRHVYSQAAHPGTSAPLLTLPIPAKNAGRSKPSKYYDASSTLPHGHPHAHSIEQMEIQTAHRAAAPWQDGVWHLQRAGGDGGPSDCTSPAVLGPSVQFTNSSRPALRD